MVVSSVIPAKAGIQLLIFFKMDLRVKPEDDERVIFVS
jgi:hypothetical protein